MATFQGWARFGNVGGLRLHVQRLGFGEFEILEEPGLGFWV